MSVLANNFKMKFAGLLRGLLRRVDVRESNGAEWAHPTIAQAPQPVVPAEPTPPAGGTLQAMQLATAAAPVPPDPKPARSASMSELEMPLQLILDKLPPDLRSKWTLGGVDLTQANVSISVEKVLPQLATGVVKITFGELRRAAPDLFRAGEEYDSLPITLPLNDVLGRLNPALLARNPGQKTLTAPADVVAPFGVGAQGVTFASTLLKPTPPTTHFFRKTVQAQSEPIKMAAPTPPLAPPPPSFTQRAITPATPVSTPIPSRAIRPAQPVHTPPPAQPSNPFVKAPAPPAAKPPASMPEIQTILAPLAALSENWPATLRLEITQSNLASAQIALPVHLVEPALKRGRVTFPWHNLRSWIRPTPPGISIHDGLELELPLSVLAPLFLPRQKREVKPQARAAVPPTSIPNLFFGFPQPQAEEMIPPLSAPESVPLVKPIDGMAKPVREQEKESESNFYVWGDGAETPSLDDTDYRRPQTPATDFSSRRAMPNQIIEQAMKLPGVVGAIVALPDGLKVAHRLPTDLNPDTVAAFLPQLFSRVSQCAKELRMGELNNLNFTIGNIPWKIFRVNSVYFAAFGRAGEPLPTAQLAMLAGQLDRKK